MNYEYVHNMPSYILSGELEMQKYWYVLGSKGHPSVKHWSYEAAKHEASRLASNNPGKMFRVVLVQAEVECNNVSVKELR